MNPEKPSQEQEVFDDDREGKTAGTTFGAAHGAIAGGVLGSLGGPGGTVVGTLVGAAAGAAIGHAVGAGANTDEVYWRENLPHQPYFEPTYDFDDYATAFRLGREGRLALKGQSFEESEKRLRDEWDRLKGRSRLKWDQARHAVRAAWERAGQTEPSDQ